jgi:phosphoglycolate phosphatase
MPSVPRYRTILFDLDGTLVDSYAALASAVNHARLRHGLPALAAEEIHGLVGHGIERLLQRAFGLTALPPTAIEAFESHYDRICCAESRTLEGVGGTLAQLDVLDIPMAVCTNKPTRFSRKILDALNLSRYFHGIVGPDLAGARKPDPRHIEATLETLPAGRNDTLFVGDMPIDIEAARNSGIDVAVIATGSATRSQLEQARPDYLLERFTDLIGLVLNSPHAQCPRLTGDGSMSLRSAHQR